MNYKFKDTADRIMQCIINEPQAINARGEAWTTPFECLMELHTEPTKEFKRNATAEHVIKSAGMGIDHFGFIAAYSPQLDRIRLPERKWFKSSDRFYSTVMHELGHSTGHESRLNRRTLTGYTDNLNNEATEEMVAEFTAAYVLNTLGLDDNNGNAAYILHWAGKTDSAKDAFVYAAIQAAQAAEYLLDKAS